MAFVLVGLGYLVDIHIHTLIRLPVVRTYGKRRLRLRRLLWWKRSLKRTQLDGKCLRCKHYSRCLYKRFVTVMVKPG